jgi:hypothetical protein
MTDDVNDGFGSSWVKCGKGCDLQVVRPGKVQCNGRGESCWDEQDVDPDAPDDMILSHLVADVNELRERVSGSSQLAMGIGTLYGERLGSLERRIEALEQAAAPVEDTQDGPWRADGTYVRGVWRGMAHQCNVGYGDLAERIAAALNAEPSAEVQAVVEAAKAWREWWRRDEYPMGPLEFTTLLAAVDRLIAKEATT